MSSCFATALRDEILAVNESAAPANIKTKFGLSVFTGQ